MAWTTTAPIDFSDTPLFCVRNFINVAGAKWTTTASKAGSDITDADFPTARLTDWFAHKPSKPSGSPATTWYLHFNAPAKADRSDVLAIIGHNFADAADPVTVEVATSHDDAYEGSGGYPGDYQLIYTFSSVSTNDRLVARPGQGSGQAVTGVERLRLKLTSASAFLPQIKEVIVGPAWSLPNPDQGRWDDRQLQSRVTRVETKSGAGVKYPRKQGQGVWQADWTITDAGGLVASGLDAHRAVYDDANWGTSFGLMIPKPDTELGEAYIVDIPEQFFAPFAAPVARSHSFVLREQPDFRKVEELG